jgi:hypothetical protein
VSLSGKDFAEQSALRWLERGKMGQLNLASELKS